MTLNQGQKVSRAIVGGIISAGIIGVIFSLTVGWTRWALLGLLAAEGLLLVNRYVADTLSETIWALSRRPLVPWLFGVAAGWSIQAGYLSDPWLTLAVGFLLGHFFFQAQQIYDSIGKDERKDRAPQREGRTS